MTESSGEDRAAAIARARALMAERDATDGATHDSDGAPPRPRQAPAKHPASASRIMAAGVAASAGLMLVATMASAAGTSAEPTPSLPQVAESQGAGPQVVHRVVTIEIPGAMVAAPEPEREVTVVREVRTIPAPAQSAASAPAQSEGS